MIEHERKHAALYLPNHQWKEWIFLAVLHSRVIFLIHSGRLAYICVSKLTIICSDNGLSPLGGTLIKGPSQLCLTLYKTVFLGNAGNTYIAVFYDSSASLTIYLRWFLSKNIAHIFNDFFRAILHIMIIRWRNASTNEYSIIVINVLNYKKAIL